MLTITGVNKTLKTTYLPMQRYSVKNNNNNNTKYEDM